MLRRILKLLHLFGSIGLAGGLGAYMIMLWAGPGPESVLEHAALRQSLAMLSKWLIVPSLLAVVLSGVLSMAVHHPFQDKGWVWAKLLSGLLIFESSLATIDGPARRAAEIAERARLGEIDAAIMAMLINDRWGAWWVLLALFAANVVLGVWRPRFSRRSR